MWFAMIGFGVHLFAPSQHRLASGCLALSASQASKAPRRFFERRKTAEPAASMRCWSACHRRPAATRESGKVDGLNLDPLPLAAADRRYRQIGLSATGPAEWRNLFMSPAVPTLDHLSGGRTG